MSFPYPQMVQLSMERNQADTPLEPDAYAVGEIEVGAHVRVVRPQGQSLVEIGHRAPRSLMV